MSYIKHKVSLNKEALKVHTVQSFTSCFKYGQILQRQITGYAQGLFFIKYRVSGPKDRVWVLDFTYIIKIKEDDFTLSKIGYETLLKSETDIHMGVEKYDGGRDDFY